MSLSSPRKAKRLSYRADETYRFNCRGGFPVPGMEWFSLNRVTLLFLRLPFHKGGSFVRIYFDWLGPSRHKPPLGRLLILGIVLFVGFHDGLNELVAHDVLMGERDDSDVVHVF